MDERADVRALLERAADTMGEVQVPSVQDLAARNTRRNGLARAVAIAAAVVAVGGVAVGVGVTASRHGDSAGPPTVSFAAPSPSSTVSARALTTYRWRAMPAAPIPVRDDPAAVWTGSRLFVWGGTINNVLRKDGALYDPSTRRWSVLPPSPLTARADTLITVVEGSVILWGGSAGTSDGARFDLSTDAWSMLPTAPAGARDTPGTAQLVGFGTSAVLVRTSPDGSSRTVQVDRYDLHTNRWTSLPTLATPANHDISSLTALALGATLFVWPDWDHSVRTGSETDTSFGTDAYRLTSGDRSWQTSPVRPAKGYSAAGAQIAGDRILFPQSGSDCGRCAGPFNAELEPRLVNARTGAGATIPNGPLGHAADNIFWTGNGVLSYDSHTRLGSSINPGAVAVWDAATRAWTRLPAAPAPRDSAQSAVVWTGDALLVWGIATNDRTPVGTGGVEFTNP